jgi:cytochrome c oxidase subunit III
MDNPLIVYKIVEEPKKPISMHPKKFAMWLFLASVGMLFAAWTSAYIVRRAEGNWIYYELPGIFKVNSFIIFLSSVTMILAYRAAKKDNLNFLKVSLILTIALGVSFLVGQVMAAGDLIKISAYFTGGNPSSSFIYVLGGVHALHIVSGIVYLLIVLNATYKFRVHSKSMAQLEMCATYWHFLGGLWLYLFVFLSLYR